jgi:hypothetical protein
MRGQHAAGGTLNSNDRRPLDERAFHFAAAYQVSLCGPALACSGTMTRFTSCLPPPDKRRNEFSRRTHDFKLAPPSISGEGRWQVSAMFGGGTGRGREGAGGR